MSNLIFNADTTEFTTTTRGGHRSSQFITFTSKKQLREAEMEILSSDKIDFLTSLIGTFSFAVHKQGKYAAITLWTSGEYKFLVANLDEKTIAIVNTVKEAKQAVIELVKSETVVATEQVEETAEIPSEIEESSDEQPAKESKKSRRNR